MGVSDEIAWAKSKLQEYKDQIAGGGSRDEYQKAVDILTALPHMQPAGEAVAYDEWRIGDERIKLVAANLQLAADLATSQDNLRMAHLALESAQSRAATPPQPSAEPQQEAQGAVAWKDRARDMLNRLNTMQPPNVVLQQVTMLGEARSIIEAALASTQPAPVDVRLHEISAFDEMADRVDALISAQPSATPFQGEG